jgi:hypothetical protein
MFQCICVGVKINVTSQEAILFDTRYSYLSRTFDKTTNKVLHVTGMSQMSAKWKQRLQRAIAVFMSVDNGTIP